VKVRIEVEGLEDVKRKLAERPELARQVANEAVEAAAKVVLELAKGAAPGPGLDMENTREAVWEVGPTAAKWYYTFFETGTASHLVLPKRRRALKIGDRFAASAHPGRIAAKPFLRPAIDEGGEKAGAAAGEVWKKAIE